MAAVRLCRTPFVATISLALLLNVLVLSLAQGGDDSKPDPQHKPTPDWFTSWKNINEGDRKPEEVFAILERLKEEFEKSDEEPAYRRDEEATIRELLRMGQMDKELCTDSFTGKLIDELYDIHYKSVEERNPLESFKKEYGSKFLLVCTKVLSDIMEKNINKYSVLQQDLESLTTIFKRVINKPSETALRCHYDNLFRLHHLKLIPEVKNFFQKEKRSDEKPVQVLVDACRDWLSPTNIIHRLHENNIREEQVDSIPESAYYWIEKAAICNFIDSNARQISEETPTAAKISPIANRDEPHQF